MNPKHYSLFLTRGFCFLLLFLMAFFYTEKMDAQRAPRQRLENLNNQQLEELAEYITEWLTVGLVQEHVEKFHAASGQGGVHTTRNFLGWHRTQVRALEDFLLTKPNGQDYVPLPKWEPTESDGTINPIPVYFNGLTPTNTVYTDYIYQPALSIVEDQLTNELMFNFSNGYFASLAPNVPYIVPGSNGYDMTTFCNFSDIGEFSDWFETNYHAAGHAGVGGAMISKASPAALIFWPYHAHIDEWWYDWENDCGSNAYDFTDPDFAPIDFLGDGQGEVIYIRGEIVVESEEVLNIQGANIHFQDSEYSGRKSGIRVMPGGVVNISLNSTIGGIGRFGNGGGGFDTDNESGSAAEAKGVIYNTPWDGIILESGFDANGLPAKVTIEDSIIEYARTGIEVKGGTGIIQATNVTFRNNRNSIVFGDEQSTKTSNSSFFNSCDFIQDEPLRDVVWKSDQVGSEPFIFYTYNTIKSDKTENHVEVYNITEEPDEFDLEPENHAMFSDCSFSNDYAGIFLGPTTRGIFSSFSSFTVSDGIFEKLIEGIHAIGNPSVDPTAVLNVKGGVDFTNIHVGIFLDHMNTSNIEDANFKILPASLFSSLSLAPAGIRIEGTAVLPHNITSCDFQTILGLPSLLDLNRGIYSALGNFIVSDCNFTGLVEGIYALGDPMAAPDATVMVTGESSFVDNLRGIVFRNVNLSTVEFSSFTIPGDNSITNISSEKPLGIYIEGPAAYVVKENEFNTNTGFSGTLNNAGVVTKHSCLDNNAWIALNNMTNLEVAVQTEGHNPNLQISCNNFFQVDGNYSIAVADGDLAEQGNCLVVPAGNTWDNTSCVNIESQLYTAPGAFGFIYNAHSNLLPNPSCVSTNITSTNCNVNTQDSPCSNLETPFLTGNDPNRKGRILALNQQILGSSDPGLQASLEQRQALEVVQGGRYTLQSNGIQAAYYYLDSLHNQQVPIYRGELAALALRIPNATAAGQHISAMSSSDPNRTYLQYLRGLVLQGKTISDLTPTEVTTLVQGFEGQFPSIPEECTIVFTPPLEELTSGLTTPIVVTDINQSGGQSIKVPSIPNTIQGESFDVKVFPNPSNGRFVINILSANHVEETNFYLFNTNGQLIDRKVLALGVTAWETHDLPAGVYWLHAQSGEKVVKEKLVVIK